MSRTFDRSHLSEWIKIWITGRQKMELGTQIRKYRNERTLSQEALAEKVYVSRQTVSNWENDKSYPDVKSLMLLSEVFEVSLDQLIKGDVEIMKEQIDQIDQTDQKRFGRLSNIFTILFLAVLITPVPLVHFLSYAGLSRRSRLCTSCPMQGSPSGS